MKTIYYKGFDIKYNILRTFDSFGNSVVLRFRFETPKQRKKIIDKYIFQEKNKMKFSEFKKQYEEIFETIKPMIISQLEFTSGLDEHIEFMEGVCNKQGFFYDLILTYGLTDKYYKGKYEDEDTSVLAEISVIKGYSIWRKQEEKCKEIEKQLLEIEEIPNNNWIISQMVYRMIIEYTKERLIKATGFPELDNIYNTQQLYNFIRGK